MGIAQSNFSSEKGALGHLLEKLPPTLRITLIINLLIIGIIAGVLNLPKDERQLDNEIAKYLSAVFFYDLDPNNLLNIGLVLDRSSIDLSDGEIETLKNKYPTLFQFNPYLKYSRNFEDINNVITFLFRQYKSEGGEPLLFQPIRIEPIQINYELYTLVYKSNLESELEVSLVGADGNIIFEIVNPSSHDLLQKMNSLGTLLGHSSTPILNEGVFGGYGYKIPMELERDFIEKIFASLQLDKDSEVKSTGILIHRENPSTDLNQANAAVVIDLNNKGAKSSITINAFESEFFTIEFTEYGQNGYEIPGSLKRITIDSTSPIFSDLNGIFSKIPSKNITPIGVNNQIPESIKPQLVNDMGKGVVINFSSDNYKAIVNLSLDVIVLKLDEKAEIVEVGSGAIASLGKGMYVLLYKIDIKNSSGDTRPIYAKYIFGQGKDKGMLVFDGIEYSVNSGVYGKYKDLLDSLINQLKQAEP